MFEIIFICAGLAIAILFFVWLGYYVMHKTNDKTIIQPSITTHPDKNENATSDEVTFHAEVADMVCGVGMIGYQGYKQPKSVKQFIISFKKDNGEIIQVSVPEDLYLGFEIGLAGELTLIDGQVSSFIPDEDSATSN